MVSKSLRKSLKAAGDKIKKERKVRRTITCILCGDILPAGTLLNHRVLKHNEQKYAPSPVRPVNPNIWTPIVGGGLPSLGKRKK